MLPQYNCCVQPTFLNSSWTNVIQSVQGDIASWRKFRVKQAVVKRISARSPNHSGGNWCENHLQQNFGWNRLWRYKEYIRRKDGLLWPILRLARARCKEMLHGSTFSDSVNLFYPCTDWSGASELILPPALIGPGPVVIFFSTFHWLLRVKLKVVFLSSRISPRSKYNLYALSMAI